MGKRQAEENGCGNPDIGAEIKFGGWYNGDNFKPGRAWYYLCCACGEKGLGQLLPQSAQNAFARHADRCPSRGGGAK